MPVPDYQEFMLPLLQLMSEKPVSVAECLPALRNRFGLSEEEASLLTPGGGKTLVADRAHWARTYMSKAGLLSSPKRKFHVATEAGLQVLASKPVKIDVQFLDSFPGFKAWRTAAGSSKSGSGATAATMAGSDHPTSTEAPASKTPEEAIKAAHDLLESSLRDDLLARLAEMNPIRFERLLLDLLSAMGFGGGDLSQTEMTKVTGDGGIDGIIHEDALGLDRVYLQAKRYAPGNNVGSPAIYQFAGSLTARGAVKGVFVTTSDFTKDARSVASNITQHRIVLIDGQELARLMIRYRVGVRPRTTFVVSSVDEDYFADA